MDGGRLEVGPGWSERAVADERWLALRGPLTLLHVRRVRAALAEAPRSG